ncbi:MAG: RNA polymerase sigma factor [Acidimicrobiales bacterium]
MTSILSNDGDESLFGDVLDRAATGDDAAVAALMAEFEPDLIRFARGQGVSEPEAVVNGALSDAFAGLSRFRGRDRRAFRAYLYQILRRRIVDQYRRAYAQPKTVAGLENDYVARLVDQEASDFDERLADRELVEEILDQLTEEQREVLEMRVLTGLSIKETATMTGRTEGAVKSMQRRALSSLRSVVIAIAVVVLAALAVRALISAGEGVVIVENAPADGPAVGGDDEQSQRPVLEAEVLEPEEAAAPEALPLATEALDDVEGAEMDDSDAESVADADADAGTGTGTGTDTESEPDSGDASTGTDAAAADAPADAGQEPPTEQTAAPIAPVNVDEEPEPSAPCSVVTDGTPAKGEIAFVQYHLSGPYELFKGTSVDIIGPAGESGLIPGHTSPDRAWNGTRLPFVISGNMLANDTFVVKTFLGGREVKTTCELSDVASRAPCVVTADDTPAAGETAKVVYRTPSPYWTLEDKATFILGKSGESAMKSGGDASFGKDVTRNFVIDASMLRDESFTVRTAFAGGAGFAVCEVR